MVDFFPLTTDNYIDVARIDKECLQEESWSENLDKEEISSPDKVYFVAVIDGCSVGFGGYAQVLDEGHIMNIAVSEEYRRRGIATAILDKMIEDGIKKGIKAFTLEVRDSNISAISLYEKKGFTFVGIRKKYYAGKEDARIYWLYL